jgi:hypothetical protein
MNSSDTCTGFFNLIYAYSAHSLSNQILIFFKTRPIVEYFVNTLSTVSFLQEAMSFMTNVTKMGM